MTLISPSVSIRHLTLQATCALIHTLYTTYKHIVVNICNICWGMEVTWHKNYAKYQKSGPIKFRYYPLRLRIRGQLPAPTVNGGGDSYWKWPDFQLWRARDLDLGSGHTAYRRASLIDLYLHAKFHCNRRNVLWTDACTQVRTDRHLRPALLGWLCRRVDVKQYAEMCKNFLNTPHTFDNSFRYLYKLNKEFQQSCSILPLPCQTPIIYIHCSKIKYLQSGVTISIQLKLVFFECQSHNCTVSIFLCYF